MRAKEELQQRWFRLGHHPGSAGNEFYFCSIEYFLIILPMVLELEDGIRGASALNCRVGRDAFSAKSIKLPRNGLALHMQAISSTQR